MRLGHDPNFKFTVGRALYKAILQYICSQHGKEYMVQPLPVSHFAIRFGKKKNTLELSWQGKEDPLEPTAKPREYIVYTRIGRGGFDNGVRVSSPFHTVKIESGIVYSFKVTAVNRGGESFPSEILAAYKAKREKGQILIVNGFDRISGPAVIDTPETVGFDLSQDPGVPYLYDISLCGTQQNFNRKEAGKRLGESGEEYEGMKIIGNTFDYPLYTARPYKPPVTTASSHAAMRLWKRHSLFRGLSDSRLYPRTGERRQFQQSGTQYILQDILLTHAAHTDLILPVGRQSPD